MNLVKYLVLDLVASIFWISLVTLYVKFSFVVRQSRLSIEKLLVFCSSSNFERISNHVETYFSFSRKSRFSSFYRVTVNYLRQINFRSSSRVHLDPQLYRFNFANFIEFSSFCIVSYVFYGFSSIFSHVCCFASVQYSFMSRVHQPCSIVVSILACHARDRGSIPRRGGIFFQFFTPPWFLFFCQKSNSSSAVIVQWLVLRVVAATTQVRILVTA